MEIKTGQIYKRNEVDDWGSLLANVSVDKLKIKK